MQQWGQKYRSNQHQHGQNTQSVQWNVTQTCIGTGCSCKLPRVMRAWKACYDITVRGGHLESHTRCPTCVFIQLKNCQKKRTHQKKLQLAQVTISRNFLLWNFVKSPFFGSRWWFHICFLFTPKLGEDEPNLTRTLFQMGWSHQLVLVRGGVLRRLLPCLFSFGSRLCHLAEDRRHHQGCHKENPSRHKKSV